MKVEQLQKQTKIQFFWKDFFNYDRKYSAQERGGYCMTTSKAAAAVVAPNPRTFRRSLLSLEVDHDGKSLAAYLTRFFLNGLEGINQKQKEKKVKRRRSVGYFLFFVRVSTLSC